ncbi:MAG: tyrosine-type recombinase/integrase [Promethearchaeota archaeon]
MRYLQILRITSFWVDKPLNEWEENEIIKVLGELQKKDYKVGTLNEFRKAFKKFFKWLHGEDWKHLKLLKRIKEKKNNPEVLSEEEAYKMIDAANYLRDKAMIAVGYEGGFRIGELGSLRIGDITFIQGRDGGLRAKANIRGVEGAKTGGRSVLLIVSPLYLKEWLDNHPNKDDLQAPVFCSFHTRRYGEPLTYQNLYRKIRDIAKKAGIKKKVNPHMLRHTRATILANNLTEAQMNEYFGWQQGSDMPQIYVHLSGRDVDNAIMKANGLEAEDDGDKPIRNRKCPRCGHVNKATDRFCSRCALILDEQERLKQEMEEPEVAKELMNYVMQNPDLLNQVKEMFELVGKMREKPELMQMLKQMREEV